MKVREAIKRVEKDGWYQVNQEGSHRQYKHPTKKVASRLRATPPWIWTRRRKIVSSNKRAEMKYAVLFEKTNTGYSAHVPDLPGCVAAGATLEETAELMRKAIQMHLAGMREDGEPIPEPRTIAEYITAA